MSGNVVSIRPSLDLIEAATEEGLSEAKAKSLLRRIARKSTGAQIFKAFADEVAKEANEQVRKGEASERARERARGERP